MPEVIDLLSSTPANSPSPGHASPHPVQILQNNDLELNSSSLRRSRRIFVSTNASSKRRRLSSYGKSPLNPETKNNDGGKTRALWWSDEESSPIEQEPSPTSHKFGLEIRPNEICLDDIVFSSSIAEPLPSKKPDRTNLIFDISSDLSDPAHEDYDIDASQSANVQTSYSRRTASILANLDENSLGSQRPIRKAQDRFNHIPSKRCNDIAGSSSDITRPAKPTQKSTSDESPGSKSRKPRDSSDKTAQRAKVAAENAMRKEEKRLERELKAKEKQRLADIAEANRSKTDRKNATPEMILELSDSSRNTTIATQVEEYMKQLGVETVYFSTSSSSNQPQLVSSDLGNVVRWKRKVTAKFNDSLGQWEPMEKMQIEDENHVLIHFTAAEFANIVLAESALTAYDESRESPEILYKTNLDCYIASVRGAYPHCTLVLVIEGLTAWLKKSTNAKNRAYTAAVRAQAAEEGESQNLDPQSSTTQPKRRRTKKESSTENKVSVITPEVAENLLLHLQLYHQPILIHHTSSASKTAAQISIFTQQLSTRPYRVIQFEQNLKSASFCMDSGQVRTGDDAQDTFVKMLQEIQRVTPSMAYGIVERWRTVRELVDGFKKEGNLMLEDVKKSVNKDGASSDRRLGPMVSKRLYKVFMGRDPAAMDGMA